MIIESVNRSPVRALTLLGRQVSTAIAKEPAVGAVRVTATGLDGDAVGNPRDHGGPDQALYLYGLDDYAWWADSEGVDVRAALFGENLTIDTLRSAELEVGDRLTIGPVVLEVTGPRIPCSTLSGRVGDGRFAARFSAARRPGAYVRVLSDGVLDSGDGIDLTACGSGVSLLDCIDAYHDPATPTAELRRVLAAPVTERLRRRLERRLVPGDAA